MNLKVCTTESAFVWCRSPRDCRWWRWICTIAVYGEQKCRGSSGGSSSADWVVWSSCVSTLSTFVTTNRRRRRRRRRPLRSPKRPICDALAIKSAIKAVAIIITKPAIQYRRRELRPGKSCFYSLLFNFTVLQF